MSLLPKPNPQSAVNELFSLMALSVMVNTKVFFAIMALVSLFVLMLGLVRFGIDLWSYYHVADSSAARILNYRGLGGTSSGLVMLTVFILLFRSRKN